MSKREAEFLQRLRAAFLVEAREHLQVVASGLLALEKATSLAGRSDQLEVVFRHTHSLKGAARAANFPRIEGVCQGLEEVFALCKRRGRILAATDFDILHRAFDLVGAYVDAGGVAPAGSSTDDVQTVTRQLQAMAAGEREPEGTGDSGAHRDAAPRGTARSGNAHRSESAAPISQAPSPENSEHVETSAGEVAFEPADERVVRLQVANTTIRVATSQLERVLFATEEMLTLKQAGIQRVGDLHRIQDGFDQWNDHWLAAQAPLRRLRMLAGQASEEFDTAAADALGRTLAFVDWTFGYIKALEGQVRSVGRAAVRDQQAAGKQVDELLDESKNLLMMPFATLAGLMPKLVRDLARDQGKEVQFQPDGGEVHLDKRVLEQLKDPLVHLVRNAIDHGIERPDQRMAAGKPEQATLRIEARLIHGQRIEVLVADDGAGMDPARLRKAAVDSGVLDKGEADQLSDLQALELAFRSDVSTSPIITEISGRGLGLAIVREQVERLGGRVTIENRAPVGVRFRITLPQSVATFRGVFVQAASQTFVIPSTHVERVARFPRAELKTVSGRETLSVDGQAVAVAHLHRLLELSPQATGAALDSVTVVLIGGGAERVALSVDEVLHDEEVLVKRLQRPLVRVRNVAGATVLACGKVVPILNVADLLKSARRVGDTPLEQPLEPTRATPIGRKVLVAEDSITSRLLLKGILEAEGCEVKTVVDGIEAFTALRSEPFDLLVSDIEMPRLNGFDLTARVRADRTLADLPIILVTALARREDRERGIDVGANAYITKGGFDQRDLIVAIRRLAGSGERE